VTSRALLASLPLRTQKTYQNQWEMAIDEMLPLMLQKPPPSEGLGESGGGLWWRKEEPDRGYDLPVPLVWDAATLVKNRVDTARDRDPAQRRYPPCALPRQTLDDLLVYLLRQRVV